MTAIEQQIRELASRTHESLLDLRQRTVDAIDPLDVGGGAVTLAVVTELDAAIQEFYDWLDGVVDNLGIPEVLERAASRWIDVVATLSTELVHTADSGDLQVEENWSGTAADAYREHIADQVSALAAIRSEYALPTAGMLTTMKDGVVNFQAGIVAALLTFGLALITAATVPVAIALLVACAASITISIWSLKHALSTGVETLGGILTTPWDRWPQLAG